MGRIAILAEFFRFAMENKKWWLLPIVILLGLLSIFILATESTALAPLVYALF